MHGNVTLFDKVCLCWLKCLVPHISSNVWQQMLNLTPTNGKIRCTLGWLQNVTMSNTGEGLFTQLSIEIINNKGFVCMFSTYNTILVIFHFDLTLKFVNTLNQCDFVCPKPLELSASWIESSTGILTIFAKKKKPNYHIGANIIMIIIDCIYKRLSRYPRSLYKKIK